MVFINKVEPTLPIEAIYGREFHSFAYSFFDMVDWSDLQKLSTLEDVKAYMIQTVPNNVARSLRTVMLNFIGFEVSHYMRVRDLGKEFFYPQEREFHWESEHYEYHLDRLDLLLDGNVCTFEYKTSEWWNLTDLRFELAWYAIGLNAVPQYEGRATHLACYNPLLNRFFFEKMHWRTIRAIKRTLSKMRTSFKEDLFPAKVGGYCRHCELAESCLNEMRGEFVENEGQ